MCGITGFIDFKRSSTKEDLVNMVDSLQHRGPDDSGTSIFEVGNAQIGLGHARLSIIDLSKGGHQPMSRGQLSIVFNGEIYNYQEIRQELNKKGYSFSSDSDTEVILHAFSEWREACVHKFIGMFAFVIIDHEKEKCLLFRDRVGVKPLFVYKRDSLFLFASELKAFHKHSHFDKKINKSILNNYLDLQYIPGNQCIFEDTIKVQPGHFCTLDLITGKLESNSYWTAQEHYNKSFSKLSYQEAKEELHLLLKSAFEYRMVADVPVGVFLSGGYDSTAVAAILQQGRTQRLKTFTIGFEHGNNEAPFAKQTADYLGTDHHEYLCTSKEAQDIIPDLPFYYDEPFADSSAIPTILVSRFARQQVTVALSADGGDELLAGYTRYTQAATYLKRLNHLPPWTSNLFDAVGTMMGAFKGRQHMKHHFKSAARTIQEHESSKRLGVLYDQMHRMPKSIHSRLLNEYNRDVLVFQEGDFRTNSISDYPLLVDYYSYLPDDILTKVDRATMSVSLEGREPLLDHRLLEFCASLPYNFKTKGNTGKILLRDIVHQYIPKEMMNRPKSGFSIPLNHWFKTDLKSLLLDSVNSSSIFDSGILNKDEVEKILKEFYAGELHYENLVWKLLMLILWYDKWGQ